MDANTYQVFLNILKEELVCAMGCTEPIALAYAAARARQELAGDVEHITVEASGSIIKNVKSVVVPNTGHLKGIPAAAIAGVVAGRPELELECISQVSPEELELIGELLEKVPVEVVHVDNGFTFDIRVILENAEHTASTRIVNYHTNIVRVERDGEVLVDVPVAGEEETGLTDRDFMTMENIWEFVAEVDLEDIAPVLERQLECNMAIAEEGMKGDWGANIGSVLMDVGPDTVRTRAKAFAAAGSDARMDGCEMPVVINSGSGNQGITASVPVAVFAQELGVSHEKLLRALALSNLVAIHQKTGLGRLSAYCGAVCAGAAAGCGIAYLQDGDLRVINHTLVNALAITSGIICDGAKPSCAAKIAASVDAGLLGYDMICRGQQFRGGDGIITKGVDNTIDNVGRLGRLGMQATNEEIISMMCGC